MSSQSKEPSRTALSADELDRLISLMSSVICSCVRAPDQVQVSYDSRQSRLLVEVSPKDRGALIGRGGRNLRALEDVLALAVSYGSGERGVTPTALPVIDVVTSRDQAR